ncbi:MAG: ABC transporter permease [Acidimicrobiia bacterium]|jgi:ABC-2 type transport system permease protein
MRPANVGRLLAKDLRLGPRSPFFLWAFVLPVFITLLVQVVFGGLFDPAPRLGIVDRGDSAIVDEALALGGIEVTVLGDEEMLLDMVERNALDAGLILAPGFDEAVVAGRRPLLELYVGGESLASNRILIALTAVDLVRGVAGEPAPVEVEVVSLGQETLDLAVRLLPFLVVFTVAIAGAMVPASSLVDEKERHTLEALLTTPVTIEDVFVAKGALGVGLGVLTGVMTLLLNGAFGGAWVATILALTLGGLMMAEFGLLLGAWARDSNTMFAAWKGGAILLIFPVIFPIFPDLPQWIARLGPTFYFLDPIFRISVEGAGLAQVRLELLIATGICIALVPVVAAMARRLERTMGEGAGVPLSPATEEEEAEPVGV